MKNGEVKKIMAEIVATNVVASRPPERRPTATATARAKIVSLMGEFGLKITSTANQKVVEFLDVKLDLENESYGPFFKPGDKPIQDFKKLAKTICTSGRRCSRSPLGGRLATTLVDCYFHHYFLFSFLFSPSSTFLIEGVLGSKNLFSKS